MTASFEIDVVTKVRIHYPDRSYIWVIS